MEDAEDQKISKPGRLHKHAIVALLVASQKGCSSIVAVDSSGLVCVWNAATGKQTTWFQAQRPTLETSSAPTPISKHASTHALMLKDEPANAHHRNTAPRRPFEIVRSKKVGDRDHQRERPWAEMPRSYAILSGFSREQASGNSQEPVFVTAATLDLLHVRLGIGFSNGSVHLYNHMSGSLLQQLLSEVRIHIH